MGVMSPRNRNQARKTALGDLARHETKRGVLIRFLAVLAVFVAYTVFVSLRYGADEGILIAWLSWSFFVFCTPIADAGLLIDLPVRLLTRIRMLYSELLVWTAAALLNAYAYAYQPQVFDATELLKLFRHIVTDPWPFGLIILLSAVGTFASIVFGDEVMDVALHKHRRLHLRHRKQYRLLLFGFVFVAVIVLYDYLLNQLGVTIG